MYWVNFLHIYQPFHQTKEILERVANESYRPLFRGFLKIPNLKINLNINGALTELLAQKGYEDIIDNIKKLAQKRRLEFAESANYHALLPFLKKKEIIRQIKKNNQINKKYFGNHYQPICFFPPEMAYSPYIGKIVSKMGHKMIILDEIAYDGGRSFPDKTALFKVKNTEMAIVFRERRMSNSIMSAIVRSKKEFLEMIGKKKKKEYFCTAMDGETFGHHRPGLEKSFFNILSCEKPKQIFFSELLDIFKIKKETSPIKSTWASSREDIERGVQFYSWKDPRNKVHTHQWRFLNYVVKTAGSKKLSPSVEKILDEAIASDQFFWASGEPWWSIEMIEKGAWTLLLALKKITKNRKEIKKGESYYKDILSTAFWWQRSGKIEEKARKYREAVRISFKERTIESGKPEVYKAFIDMMRKKMRGASKNKNFEKAILWRDAIWKLETKNDIYDAVHAVDLLRVEVPDDKLRKLMDKYKKKYQKIKSGQPELRHFD